VARPRERKENMNYSIRASVYESKKESSGNTIVRGFCNLVGRTHHELDLLDPIAVKQFFDEDAICQTNGMSRGTRFIRRYAIRPARSFEMSFIPMC